MHFGSCFFFIIIIIFKCIPWAHPISAQRYLSSPDTSPLPSSQFVTDEYYRKITYLTKSYSSTLQTACLKISKLLKSQSPLCLLTSIPTSKLHLPWYSKLLVSNSSEPTLLVPKSPAFVTFWGEYIYSVYLPDLCSGTSIWHCWVWWLN